jgi:manganese/zinc/iron transport system permease protein
MDLRAPALYFTDPVLRAPTIGSMLMCLTAALVGVIVFLRRQSLLGESLSHATYPGVILGVVAAALLGVDPAGSTLAATCIVVGAFVAALLGLWTIDFLEKKARVRSDSALCFVLASFFGIGLTIASRVQVTHTQLYKQIQMYLYGQAATMTDLHILLYGVLSFVVIAVMVLLYKELQAVNFDRDYASSIGLPAGAIESAFFFLVLLAVVIGIRCVGVVLMSAMLIAPAAAARQYTNRLSLMLILAGVFGLVSGFLGNYLSVELSLHLMQNYEGRWLALPTGPSIVVVASCICVLSLLFAPERGLVRRLFRVAHFRYRCMEENLLKAIWRKDPEGQITSTDLLRVETASRWMIGWTLRRLASKGWLVRHKSGAYSLSSDGTARAAHIVRLHRLWELYLTEFLGMGVERVHPIAEEMEHIITPDLEKRLNELLNHPKTDPHQQPIPPPRT